MASPETNEELTTEELCARLNAEMRASLRSRRTSFFSPELNGPKDPHGLLAFHAGDTDVTDGHLDRTAFQEAQRKINETKSS